MVNYRINRTNTISGTGTMTASAAIPVWGVLRATTPASGTISLAGGGTLKVEHLAVGTPIPLYFNSISVTAGIVYILS
jgi:hypothetical protein